MNRCKKAYGMILAVILLLCMVETINAGQAVSAQQWTETVEPKYEQLMERVLNEMSEFSGKGGKFTTVVFDTIEEAKRFGHLFQLYGYFGKEHVGQKVYKQENGWQLMLECEDFNAASAQQSAVIQKLTEVVNAAANRSEREKAEYFYDWVYDRMSYDESLTKKTVYDAVMDRSGVCWGFTAAYWKLCRMSGIESEAVFKGDHAWNRIRIGGEWLYSDITWDKCGGPKRWRLIPEAEMWGDRLHLEQL